MMQLRHVRQRFFAYLLLLLMDKSSNHGLVGLFI